MSILSIGFSQENKKFVFLLFILRLKETRTVLSTDPASQGCHNWRETKMSWITNNNPSNATALINQPYKALKEKDCSAAKLC